MMPVDYLFSDISGKEGTILLQYKSQSEVPRGRLLDLVKITQGQDMDVLVEINPRRQQIDEELFDQVLERYKKLGDQELGILDPRIEKRIAEYEATKEQLAVLERTTQQYELIVKDEKFSEQSESKRLARKWIEENELTKLKLQTLLGESLLKVKPS